MSQDNISDITPPTNPVSIARDMLKDAPQASAGAYVLVKENGETVFDMCGEQRQMILWGLQKMILRLLTDGQL